MDEMTGHDRQALLAQLAQAREVLDARVQHLRAIDAELEALATESRQHRLLHDACAALEDLGATDGAELFWGDRAAASNGEALIRRARSRVDVFQKRTGEIEERRQAALEEVDRQQNETFAIEYDVLEAEDEEERRAQEWIVEREMGELPIRTLMMPWTRGGEEDERFRKLLALAMLWSLLFPLVVPMIDLSWRELQEEAVEVPERVVRLMMEARPLPPPPPPAVTIPEPKPAEPVVAEEAQPPTQTAKPKEGPGVGPAEGPGKGLLAFREEFKSFKQNQSISRLGAQANIRSPGAESGAVERSMLTTQAAGSSGGINLSSISRGVVGGGGGGGGKLEGVQVARATSTIGGGGGRGSGASIGGNGAALGRTDEEIQIVFDRHKASLYRLYNRELRRDPTLKGQMVLRIRIEPDGSVTLCELQGTDMNAQQLVAQVLERVRTFDFGAKEGIVAVTILYPIDFLPAT